MILTSWFWYEKSAFWKLTPSFWESHFLGVFLTLRKYLNTLRVSKQFYHKDSVFLNSIITWDALNSFTFVEKIEIWQFETPWNLTRKIVKIPFSKKICRVYRNIFVHFDSKYPRKTSEVTELPLLPHFIDAAAQSEKTSILRSWIARNLWGFEKVVKIEEPIQIPQKECETF